MELERAPFQGVLNILKFNWHFYVITGSIFIAAILLFPLLPSFLQSFIFWILILAIGTILISLVVSWYVYDLSNLYQLPWIEEVDYRRILNIHAGFDETSNLIKHKFPRSEVAICDFYDPQKHTEVSIKRARKAYPIESNTLSVTTQKLPFEEGTFDLCLVILSAHEIRRQKERIGFFNELRRITKPKGKIAVTEHLRDVSNFTAYTLGAFHFHSRATWLHTFKEAQLIIEKEIKTTPFITSFILQHGNTF
ncbi:MAG: methyltransferase domain-containing protein [Flavobacteriaceae bacterium]